MLQIEINENMSKFHTRGTVEALINRYPREAGKVPTSGAGYLWEWVNTELL